MSSPAWFVLLLLLIKLPACGRGKRKPEAPSAGTGPSWQNRGGGWAEGAAGWKECSSETGWLAGIGAIQHVAVRRAGRTTATSNLHTLLSQGGAQQRAKKGQS